MRIKNTFQLILVIAFCGCCFGCSSQQNQYNKLIRVDSLLNKCLVDSALSMINNIEIQKSKEDNFIAYYNLLQTRLAYMQYKPNIKVSALNQSIAIYTKQNNKQKLAQTLYYKGAILYEQNHRKEAIKCLKQSEYIAISIHDYTLQNEVFKQLSVINNDIEDLNLAIKYAYKSLNITLNNNNLYDLADIYNIIAVCYGKQKIMDSARYYINKCIPLIKHTPNNEKIILLDNIGYLNMTKSPQMALKYLNEAMKIGPSPDTYDNLARLYIKVGEKQKADSLWEKALQTKDILKKSQIVEAMLKYKQQERDYVKITELTTRLLALKDSVSAQRQEERLKEMQMDFDYQVEQTMHEKKEIKMKYTILSLFLILVIMVLLTSTQRIKAKKAFLEKENELLEKQGLLQQYHNNILQMEKNDKADKNEINRLKKKVEKLQCSIDRRSYQGSLLYNIAKQGKSIRNWNKSELQEFLYFYISVDLNYSLSLEECGNLTARQKVFLILKHEGKSDNKIAEMLGLNNAALRTMKSRIHKIWKEPSE